MDSRVKKEFEGTLPLWAGSTSRNSCEAKSTTVLELLSSVSMNEKRRSRSLGTAAYKKANRFGKMENEHEFGTHQVPCLGWGSLSISRILGNNSHGYESFLGEIRLHGGLS